MERIDKKINQATGGGENPDEGVRGEVVSVPGEPLLTVGNKRI